MKLEGLEGVYLMVYCIKAKTLKMFSSSLQNRSSNYISWGGDDKAHVDPASLSAIRMLMEHVTGSDFDGCPPPDHIIDDGSSLYFYRRGTEEGVAALERKARKQSRANSLEVENGANSKV